MASQDEVIGCIERKEPRPRRVIAGGKVGIRFLKRADYGPGVEKMPPAELKALFMGVMLADFVPRNRGARVAPEFPAGRLGFDTSQPTILVAQPIELLVHQGRRALDGE